MWVAAGGPGSGGRAGGTLPEPSPGPGAPACQAQGVFSEAPRLLSPTELPSGSGGAVLSLSAQAAQVSPLSLRSRHRPPAEHTLRNFATSGTRGSGAPLRTPTPLPTVHRQTTLCCGLDHESHTRRSNSCHTSEPNLPSDTCPPVTAPRPFPAQLKCVSVGSSPPTSQATSVLKAHPQVCRFLLVFMFWCFSGILFEKRITKII